MDLIKVSKLCQLSFTILDSLVDLLPVAQHGPFGKCAAKRGRALWGTLVKKCQRELWQWATWVSAIIILCEATGSHMRLHYYQLKDLIRVQEDIISIPHSGMHSNACLSHAAYNHVLEAGYSALHIHAHHWERMQWEKFISVLLFVLKKQKTERWNRGAI